jgi:hypothetical protein
LRDIVVVNLAEMAGMAVSAAGIGAGESGVDFKEELTDAQEERGTLFLDEHDCKCRLVFEITLFSVQDRHGREGENVMKVPGLKRIKPLGLGEGEKE